MNIGNLARPVAFYYLGNLSIILINSHKYLYDVIVSPSCHILSINHHQNFKNIMSYCNQLVNVGVTWFETGLVTENDIVV